MHRGLFAAAFSLVAAATPGLAADLDKPAHDFRIVTLDGQKLTSEDLKGKVVVLNYWASWCGPCKAELLAFDDYLRHHPGTDLKVYSVETETSLPRSYLQKMQSAAAFTVATHVNGRGYGILGGFPTSFVIDRGGVLRHAEAGAFNAQSFAALVDPLLKEPAPAPQTTVAAK